MQDSSAIIERVRRVSTTTQRLDIAVEGSQRAIQAGQYFLARLTESWDPYLREPWLPIQARGEILTIERPVDVVYQPGQVVRLLGPIGQPIPLLDGTRTLLLIAYDTAPTALLMLAGQAIERGISVTLALIGAARNYALEALPVELEVLRGDDKGGWTDQRASLGWANQIVAVALSHDLSRYSQLLEAATKVRVEVPAGYVSGLFQPPILCGIGACGVCLVACHQHEVLACVEGPAFDLRRVSLR